MSGEIRRDTKNTKALSYPGQSKALFFRWQYSEIRQPEMDGGRRPHPPAVSPWLHAGQPRAFLVSAPAVVAGMTALPQQICWLSDVPCPVL